MVDITIIGIFNANSLLYICIKYMISKHILLITFLKKPGLIFSHSKWFTYFPLLRSIVCTINHLFAYSLMFSSIAINHKQFN